MADTAERWEPTPGGGSTETDDVRDTAREKADELKQTVRESSTQIRSSARDWMQEEVDQRTSAVASQARTIADAMRQTSDRLDRDGQPQAARVTDVLAERVDGVARYLDEADGERMMNDLRDAARRNPWAFAAAGLVAGFAASRFMKASRPEEPPTSYGSSYGTSPTSRSMSSYGTPSYGTRGGSPSRSYESPTSEPGGGAYGDAGATGA